MPNTYNVNINALKDTQSELSVDIKKNGIKLFSKIIGLNIALRSSIDISTYIPPTMATVYPDTYQTMSSIPDKIIGTEKLTDMSNMFKDCQYLDNINDDLSDFNTSNVTNMDNMFTNCYCWDSLDIGHFDVSNVTSMNEMFASVLSTSVNIPSEFSDFVSMRGMFYSCNRLYSVVAAHNDCIINPQYATGMFSDCPLLREINGIIFNMAGCLEYENMFKDCPNLTGVQIMNPPEDFEGVPGLNSNQYTIVT